MPDVLDFGVMVVHPTMLLALSWLSSLLNVSMLSSVMLLLEAPILVKSPWRASTLGTANAAVCLVFAAAVAAWLMLTAAPAAAYFAQATV